MEKKGPVVVLTSKIIYNTGKFIVNVYEPLGLLFLNGKKKAKEEFFFFFASAYQGWIKDGTREPKFSTDYSSFLRLQNIFLFSPAMS